MKLKIYLFLIFVLNKLSSQVITGKISYNNLPVKDAIITLNKKNKKTISDSLGNFQIKTDNHYVVLTVYHTGFLTYTTTFKLITDTNLNISLSLDTTSLNEIIIEAEKPLLNKKPDAFNTEVYDACVLTSSSASNLFEGVQNINGLRPQLNCNICNTGDIHINGMEGPYTNILIDGMPVIGGIASIYGMTGIPSAIIEKIEINRYPGSVLYGINNIGGTINIVTKKMNDHKKLFNMDYYTSNYMDNSMDLSYGFKRNKMALLGAGNIVWFDKIFDVNKDGFTDITLQKRGSLMQKINYTIDSTAQIELLARSLYEDRWGGQTHWNKTFAGTDSIYGEYILTKRLEIIGKVNKSIKKLHFNNHFSYNYHAQDSYYGTLHFTANQQQFYYQSFFSFYLRNIENIMGVALNLMEYKDNTKIMQNSVSYTKWIVPSIYSEHTIQLNDVTRIIPAWRYDYHNIHGSIFTPRISGIMNLKRLTVRMGITSGFRPVQLFSEDHAALTGARKIIIKEQLKPEKSYVGYFNIQHEILTKSRIRIMQDFNTWAVYFTNRIIPDYSEADKIQYHNLHNQYSINRGISYQISIIIMNNLQMLIGYSLLDNYIKSDSVKTRLFLSEPWSGNWVISYQINKMKIEYTGNIYGKMKLPLASELDPRPSSSPVFSIQNLQMTYSLKKLKFTMGVKNLLDFTPDKNIPFLIARSHDPFDKNVLFDNNGIPISTQENPYALTFDPTYTYASMQKRRFFIAITFDIQ